jgi:hypothetical protein
MKHDEATINEILGRRALKEMHELEIKQKEAELASEAVVEGVGLLF